MAFDLAGLRAAVARHGRVSRVVIAATQGSTPREVGAAMLVWEGGQSGSIGGGALEFELARLARRQTAPRRLSRHALGPEMGQCCGGAVEVLSEIYTAAELELMTDQPVIARAVEKAGAMPLAVSRLIALERAQGILPEPRLIQGWMVEPLKRPTRVLWIWGAGHVGRALVQVLAPLPGLEITWIDTDMARFPKETPDGISVLAAHDPVRLVGHAPQRAEHLILTYSHALDLELCHALLGHGFADAGLIGSATKWARFARRLADLGHGADQIARIACPIGTPGLGKHPQMIAIGVAAQFLGAASNAGTKARSSFA
ncbi:xanthine dehydrogenase accessory protein XdhC [Roseovarius sp.]|uniref:xanthine dehydrogenase accessory protein XdhC n=1 Tax=Roseovarius sp. TaxID=1486281 RepID=UPI002603A8DF|nr:xanthine dehydrogenase accessory protein XdhC [Roseovarius sp.]